MYLPTYGVLSSIEKLVKPLAELKDQYQIITKVHHGTSFLEPDRMELLKILPDVRNHRESLSKLLEEADLVISDGSGAIFDAIATKTPVLIYNMNSYHSLDDERSLPIEEKIIKEHLVLSFDDPNQLKEKVNTLLSEDGKTYMSNLEQLYHMFFSCSSKSGLKRVFQLLDQLLAGKIDLTNQQITKKLLMEHCARSESYQEVLTLREKLQEKNQQLEEKEKFIHDILNSKSWRYTKIFRNKR